MLEFIKINYKAASRRILRKYSHEKRLRMGVSTKVVAIHIIIMFMI